MNTSRRFFVLSGLFSLPFLAGCGSSNRPPAKRKPTKSGKRCYDAARTVALAHIDAQDELDVAHREEAIAAATQLVLEGEMAAPRSHDAFVKLMGSDWYLQPDREALWSAIDSMPYLQLVAPMDGTPRLQVYSVTAEPGKTANRFCIPASGNELLPYPCLWALVSAGLKDVFHHDDRIHSHFAGRTTDWSKLASAVAIAYIPSYVYAKPGWDIGPNDIAERTALEERMHRVHDALNG